MNTPKSESPEVVVTQSAFTSALSKLVSVPRAEVQQRAASAPSEKTSKHKRYKYAPEARPAKT